MDKEAQWHKNKILAIKGIYDVVAKAPSLQAKQGEAWAIAEHLYNLGYRKPKEKPPFSIGHVDE